MPSDNDVLAERMTQRRLPSFRRPAGHALHRREVLPVIIDERHHGDRSVDHRAGQPGEPLERRLCAGVHQAGRLQLGEARSVEQGRRGLLVWPGDSTGNSSVGRASA